MSTSAGIESRLTTGTSTCRPSRPQLLHGSSPGRKEFSARETKGSISSTSRSFTRLFSSGGIAAGMRTFFARSCAYASRLISSDHADSQTKSGKVPEAVPVRVPKRVPGGSGTPSGNRGRMRALNRSSSSKDTGQKRVYSSANGSLEMSTVGYSIPVVAHVDPHAGHFTPGNPHLLVPSSS